MKGNVAFLPIALLTSLTLTTVHAQTPRLNEYGVDALQISLNQSKTGLEGNRNCVKKISVILRGAGISVQEARTTGDNQQNFGIVIGYYQQKLIVSGSCLSGGKEAVISVVNPFENKSARDLMQKIRAQLQ